MSLHRRDRTWIDERSVDFRQWRLFDCDHATWPAEHCKEVAPALPQRSAAHASRGTVDKAASDIKCQPRVQTGQAGSRQPRFWRAHQSRAALWRRRPLQSLCPASSQQWRAASTPVSAGKAVSISVRNGGALRRVRKRTGSAGRAGRRGANGGGGGGGGVLIFECQAEETGRNRRCESLREGHTLGEQYEQALTCCAERPARRPSMLPYHRMFSGCSDPRSLRADEPCSYADCCS